MPDDEVAAMIAKIDNVMGHVKDGFYMLADATFLAIEADIRRLVEERDEWKQKYGLVTAFLTDPERVKAAEADAARLAEALRQLKPIAWFGKAGAEADGYKNTDERFVKAATALAAHDARLAAAGKART